ncbi:hypothetical protein HSBGL_0590 [Halapricum desulfuricans]|uniref:Uncharacterized protein n=1 Tax=Halapricum desulfuricans TaxID=2841257 RepID=A0A897NHW3_9EURY|nr:hypothetical protein HSBGL_0590 [Halapricum desulfuricans]
MGASHVSVVGPRVADRLFDSCAIETGRTSTKGEYGAYAAPTKTGLDATPSNRDPDTGIGRIRLLAFRSPLISIPDTCSGNRPFGRDVDATYRSAIAVGLFRLILPAVSS